MTLRITLTALLLSMALWTSSPRLALAQTDTQAPTAEASDDDAEESGDASDDIFLPSEEIQADSEISFPSDI